MVDADEVGDGEADLPGVRQACTLDPIMLERLRKLAKGKWFGRSVPKVMVTLIENGIREARRDGYLTLDD